MKEALFQDSEQEAQIAGLLRANVFTYARLAWGMNFLLLLVGFCALQSLSLNVPLSTWAAIGIAVFLLRLPSVVKATRVNAPSVNKPIYLFGLFLCGAVWGAFAYVNLPALQGTSQLIVVGLPMLACMISLMTLNAWLPAFHAFTWPLAAPFLATLALHADGAYQSMLPVAGCFFGFCMLLAHVMNRQARQVALLQIQNNAYMRELSLQNLQFNRARVQAESALEEFRRSQSGAQDGSVAANGEKTQGFPASADAPAEDELAFLDKTVVIGPDDGEQTLRISAA